MTEEERKRANDISQWLKAHPGINYHVSPRNYDRSVHILLWRDEKIWIGPEYMVSHEKFKKISDDPIPFLDKAYSELLEIEEKEKEKQWKEKN